MSKLAEISVVVTAEITKFEKNIVKSSSILSGFQTNISTCIGKLVDFSAVATGAAVVGLGYIVDKTIENVVAQTRLADRIGMSTEMVGGFATACSKFGVSSEEATTALNHLNKTLGEAFNGNEEAQAIFERMNIDLKAISAVDADTRLKMVADAFKGISSSASKAELAQKLMGKSAQAMVPVLDQGGAALSEVTKQALASGNALNGIDSRKIVEAHEEFEQLKRTLSGLATTLTVELAPFIKAAAAELNAMGKDGNLNTATIVDGFEEVLQALATVADYFELVKVGFYSIREVGVVVLRTILEAVAELGKGIEELYNLLSGDKSTAVKDFFNEMDKGLTIEAGNAAEEIGKAWDAFNEGANSTKATDMFAKIRKDAKAAAEEAQKIFDDKKAKGIAEDIDNAIKNADAAENKKQAKAMDDLKKKADDFTKGLRTNAEKFQDTMKETIELLKAGLIDPETYLRGKDKATTDYVNAETKGDKDVGGEAAVINTKLISIEGLKNNPNEEKKTEVHSQQQEEANKLLEQIKTAIENQEAFGKAS